MRINLSSAEIPEQLANLPANTRVTMTVEFEIDFIDTAGGGLSMGGEITSHDVKEARGVGGTDPLVESQQLRALAMRPRFHSTGVHG